jgi:hypothetical protein
MATTDPPLIRALGLSSHARACGVAVLLGASLVVVAGCADHGAPRSQSQSPTIVGVWRVTNYSVFRDERQTQPFGPAPRGYVIYAASGQVMFEVSARDGQTQESPAPHITSADSVDLRRLLQTFAGFFGTYSVDYQRHTITHRLEGELPRGPGSVEVATSFRQHGDTLVIGRDSVARWVFTRVSPR